MTQSSNTSIPADDLNRQLAARSADAPGAHHISLVGDTYIRHPLSPQDRQPMARQHGVAHHEQRRELKVWRHA